MVVLGEKRREKSQQNAEKNSSFSLCFSAKYAVSLRNMHFSRRSDKFFVVFFLYADCVW